MTPSTSHLLGNEIYGLEFYYNQPVDVWLYVCVCVGGNFAKVFTCSLNVSKLIYTQIIINDDPDTYDNEEEDTLILYCDEVMILEVNKQMGE